MAALQSKAEEASSDSRMMEGFTDAMEQLLIEIEGQHGAFRCGCSFSAKYLANEFLPHVVEVLPT